MARAEADNPQNWRLDISEDRIDLYLDLKDDAAECTFLRLGARLDDELEGLLELSSTWLAG